MKKILSMCMAVAVVFGMGLVPSVAAETKPIAALAVASYNDLISDVNFVGELVDRPQLGATVEGLLALVTQGKGLAGVDKTRPWARSSKLTAKPTSSATCTCPSPISRRHWTSWDFTMRSSPKAAFIN